MREKYKNEIKKDILCALLLLCAAFAFMGDVFLRGRVLVPADILNAELPWSNGDPAAANVKNSSLFDALLGVYPFQTHATNMLRAGDVPLWNPWQFSGTPFAADGHSGVFYPPARLILLASGVAHGLGLNALIHLWLAGLGMFLLLRFLRTGRPGAMFSALAYMFCGWFIYRLSNKPLVECPAWLPFLFLFYMLAVRRKKLVFAVFGGLVFAMQILTGMLQIAVYSGGVLLFLALWDTASSLASREKASSALRAIAAFAIITAIGTALAAIQLLPSFELLSLSPRAAQTSSSALHGFISSFSPMIITFMPDFFGNPLLKNTWSALGVMGLVTYCGIITLFLAFAGAICSRNRAKTFFAVLALLSPLIAINSFIYYFPARLFPILNVFLIERFTLFFMFSAALLAGFGLDTLISSEKPRRVRFSILSGAIAIALAAAFLTLANIHLRPELSLLNFWQKEGGQVIRLISLLVMSVIILLASKKLGPRAAAVLCAAMLVLDLGQWGIRFNSTSAPADVFPPSQIVETIKSDVSGPFRIHAFMTGHILIPDSCSALGLQDVRGYNSLYFSRYHDLLREFQEQRQKGSFVSDRWLNFTVFNVNLLKLLNVKYVMTPRPVHQYRPELELVQNAEGIYLYRLKPFTPRARLVETYAVAKSDKDALRVLTAPGFNPDASAVLFKKPDFAGGGTPLRSRETSARIVSWKPQHISLEVNSPRRSILVLSEIDYPGWNLSLDGKPSPHLRADYTFIGVPLEPGFHKLSFSYSPASARNGLAASMITLAFAAVFLFAYLLIYKSPAAHE